MYKISTCCINTYKIEDFNDEVISLPTIYIYIYNNNNNNNNCINKKTS